MIKPDGILKFHKITVTQNSAAVYYDVQFIDSKGDIFEGHASHFLVELKQVKEKP